MFAAGPRIDPHKLYTIEELRDFLPASLLRSIIAKAAAIDGLFSGRQVGDLVEAVFREASHGMERSASSTSGEKRTYLTIAEVAEILHSSPREVTRLVDVGKLKAIDLNEGQGKKKRQLRFRREWIQELEDRLVLRPDEQPKPRFGFSAKGFSRKK